MSTYHQNHNLYSYGNWNGYGVNQDIIDATITVYKGEGKLAYEESMTINVEDSDEGGKRFADAQIRFEADHYSVGSSKVNFSRTPSNEFINGFREVMGNAGMYEAEYIFEDEVGGDKKEDEFIEEGGSSDEKVYDKHFFRSFD